MYQKPKSCARLISCGANACLQDTDGRTPAHYAVADNLVNILKHLLKENGAEISNVKDYEGRTLLHLAAGTSSGIECAQLILELDGIDVNARDDLGAAPLHWAAVYGNTNFCILLVRHGAYLSLQDIAGKIPLDYAGDQTCAVILERLKVNPLIEFQHPAQENIDHMLITQKSKSRSMCTIS